VENRIWKVEQFC